MARCAIALGAVLAVAACRSHSPSSTAAVNPPDVRLQSAAGDAPASVELSQLSTEALEAMRALDRDGWMQVLRVSAIDGDSAGEPIAGEYTVDGGVVRFTSDEPLAPGARYRVEFDPAPLARAGAAPAAAPTSRVLSVPVSTTPATPVVHVYPSGRVVPENLVRVYLEFSGPMSLGSDVSWVRLLDARGVEIENAFLPGQAGRWDAERRRFTLLLNNEDGADPRSGPSDPQVLRRGRRYTLVIDSGWPDAKGRPLGRRFTHTFRVGPPMERPLAPRQWTVAAPPAGTREPLVVTMPHALDYVLLTRALGVRDPHGTVLNGVVSVDRHERRWQIAPTQPWQAGRHTLVALSALEDPSGNRLESASDAEGASLGPRDREHVAKAFEIR